MVQEWVNIRLFDVFVVVVDMLCVLQPTKTLVFVVRSAQGAGHTVRCRFNCVQADVCLCRTCLNWSAIYKPQLSLLCEISGVRVVLSFYHLCLSVRPSVQCGTVSKQAVLEAATIYPRPLQVDLWSFDLGSGVRVTCDVDYLYANFSLPISLSVLELGPMYATDRQTSYKSIVQCLCPRGGGGGIIKQYTNPKPWKS